MNKLLINFLLIFIIANLTACSKLAVFFTPGKKPVASQTKLAAMAEQKFWQTLHQGQYQQIPQTEKLLLAAYLENPNDPQLAAHLGFLHIWQIAERQRLATQDPQIVNNIILATKYFSDAVELAPTDARYLGFLGDSMLIQGKIFNDQRQQTQGYFILKDAISAWPQFNYFTAGYPMSSLPADSKQFAQGLQWQWQNLDICAGEKVNRNNPDFSKYMRLQTQQGPQRACWNSEIAPYNFEGFFLNMGDMLVKSGDWQTGIKIYRNAKLASNYSTWPYRQVLEDRINQAQPNVAEFNQTQSLNSQIIRKKVVMFNSKFSCMACHLEAGTSR